MAERKCVLPVIVVLLAAGVVAVGFVLRGYFGRNDDATRLIGITQIASHPSLDEVREGTVEGLRQRGYEDGENIRILFRNANGDPSLTLPIAQDFVRQNADVIVPITTPSALGAAKSTDKIPIVFGGVTDPVGVGLVSSMEAPGGNVTGTSDQWPFKEQLAFFQQIFPELRRLGILYQPGDDVSGVGVNEMKKHAPGIGVDIEARPVSGASDIYATAVSILRDVDAIYVGPDNLVVENVATVLKAGREAGKPIVAGDAATVERGALAAVSIGMKDVGLLTGDIVADVLEGAAPKDLPVRILTSGRFVVNRKAASELDLDMRRFEQIGVDFIGADETD